MAAASGSDIICRALPMPAFSAHALVFACAVSDHTAGTVIIYSIGVERRTLWGSLCLRTCSVCVRSAVR